MANVRRKSQNGPPDNRFSTELCVDALCFEFNYLIFVKPNVARGKIAFERHSNSEVRIHWQSGTWWTDILVGDVGALTCWHVAPNHGCTSIQNNVKMRLIPIILSGAMFSTRLSSHGFCAGSEAEFERTRWVNKNRVSHLQENRAKRWLRPCYIS